MCSQLLDRVWRKYCCWRFSCFVFNLSPVVSTVRCLHCWLKLLLRSSVSVVFWSLHCEHLHTPGYNVTSDNILSVTTYSQWQWFWYDLSVEQWTLAWEMPAILGPFESSLRGRRSVGEDDQSGKMVLHHSCSGASHGFGVKKDRVRLERERDRRNCSLPPDLSSGHVPDILMDSLSSPGPGHAWHQNIVSVLMNSVNARFSFLFWELFWTWRECWQILLFWLLYFMFTQHTGVWIFCSTWLASFICKLCQLTPSKESWFGDDNCVHSYFVKMIN